MTRSLRLTMPAMVACVLLGTAMAGAQAPAEPAASAASGAASSSADPASRIAGPWRLNADLSSKPPDPNALPGDTPDNGDNGSGSGGASGNGRRRGYGRGYGGYGGRGNTSAATNPAQAADMRIVFRELTGAPVGLTIVASAASVEITDSDGIIRRFIVDDQKQTMDMESATVGVTSHWNHNVLEQRFEVGSSSVTRTIQTSDDDRELIINVTPIARAGQRPASDGAGAPTAGGQSGGAPGGQPAAATPLRFVYDRN